MHSKKYIEQHAHLPPHDIAEQFKTDFFTDEGINAFLATRNINATLPKLSTLNVEYTPYGTVVKNYLTELTLLIPPMMSKYTPDAYFTALKLIEDTFSQNQIDRIKDLKITQKQELLKILYNGEDGPHHAKQYLKSL